MSLTLCAFCKVLLKVLLEMVLSMRFKFLRDLYCSHLDRDGDGYISVEEVAVLLEELGIDVGQQQVEAARLGQGQGQGQDLGHLPSKGAGQKLLGALANKEPSRVNFEEFLQYNSQVSTATAACVMAIQPGSPQDTAQLACGPICLIFSLV